MSPSLLRRQAVAFIATAALAMPLLAATPEKAPAFA